MIHGSAAWIPFRLTAPAPRIRMFCFAYAGGSASVFRSWSLRDVDICPIQLPGRQNRMNEPAFTRMPALIDALEDVFSHYDDLPQVFFGHSLGAFVAYEAALRLGAVSLIVSGCPAPHLTRPKQPVHLLPDREFMTVLDELGGIPPAIRESRDLMSLFLPVLRSDMELHETYSRPIPTRLPCDVIAFGGEDDRSVQPWQLDAWRQVSDDFQVRFFPGGHFFLRDAEADLLTVIEQELSRVCAR